MKTFMANKVAVAPTQKPPTQSSSVHEHLTVPLANIKKTDASVKSIARFFFQHRRSTMSMTMHSEIPPSLSTSTSISSIRSSVSIPKKISADAQSSKSIEFESLIMEQPMRTLRVSLTPDYAV